MAKQRKKSGSCFFMYLFSNSQWVVKDAAVVFNVFFDSWRSYLESFGQIKGTGYLAQYNWM